MIKVSLSGNTIYLRLFSMKECDAIRQEYNCFISMIISVDTLCGFAPLTLKVVGSPREGPTRAKSAGQEITIFNFPFSID